MVLQGVSVQPSMPWLLFVPTTFHDMQGCCNACVSLNLILSTSAVIERSMKGYKDVIAHIDFRWQNNLKKKMQPCLSGNDNDIVNDDEFLSTPHV